MTQSVDPRQELVAQLSLSVVIALALVAVAATWAVIGFRTRPTTALITTPPGGAAAPPAPPLDPRAWNVALWRPLSDAPAAVAVAAPLQLKLFSILKQGDDYTAAIDVGEGADLHYVRAGAKVKGVTVTAVDASGISVLSGSSTLRLELAP